MSENFTLDAETRKRAGGSDVKRMRKEGLVPAVIYGAKQENENLKVSARELRELMARSASSNILVDLKISNEGAEKGSRLALIQDIQRDYINDTIQHVDFYAVDENAIITASVPVELEGPAIGVKNGGILDQQIYALDVKCLPKDLPQTLLLNIEAIDIGDTTYISDVVLPEGVETVLDGSVIVVMVTETKAAISEGEDGEEEEGAEGEEAEGEEGSESKEGEEASKDSE